MQIAAPAAPPPAPLLLSRLTVARATATPGGPGALRIDSHSIVLRALAPREPGGLERSTWFRAGSSSAGGGTVRMLPASAAERTAALAARDALEASGLLALPWAPFDGRVQAPGTVRLWLGLHQRYLEAPVGAVPAAMQNVLDAVERWRRAAAA